MNRRKFLQMIGIGVSAPIITKVAMALPEKEVYANTIPLGTMDNGWKTDEATKQIIRDGGWVEKPVQIFQPDIEVLLLGAFLDQPKGTAINWSVVDVDKNTLIRGGTETYNGSYNMSIVVGGLSYDTQFRNIKFAAMINGVCYSSLDHVLLPRNHFNGMDTRSHLHLYGIKDE